MIQNYCCCRNYEVNVIYDTDSILSILQNKLKILLKMLKIIQLILELE
jgi:hypothetical protein